LCLFRGGDEADAAGLELVGLIAAQDHRRRVRELREQEAVEVKVCQTERIEIMRLLAGIRCTVDLLPDALLWCPSAGEPQQVSLNFLFRGRWWRWCDECALMWLTCKACSCGIGVAKEQQKENSEVQTAWLLMRITCT
jgi:hypothetical protein